MSQYHIGDELLSVTCGYDPRLRTFHLTIRDEGQVEYSSLEEPYGELTREQLAARLEKYDIGVPDGLMDALMLDEAGLNPTNHTVCFDLPVR